MSVGISLNLLSQWHPSCGATGFSGEGASGLTDCGTGSGASTGANPISVVRSGITSGISGVGVDTSPGVSTSSGAVSSSVFISAKGTAFCLCVKSLCVNGLYANLVYHIIISLYLFIFHYWKSCFLMYNKYKNRNT